MGEKVKHTPGPWTLEGEDQFARVLSPDGYTIAESDHIHCADLDDAAQMHVANMRLIAAAPDLLAACKAMLRIVIQVTVGIVAGVNFHEVVNDAVAAIDKAEGVLS